LAEIASMNNTTIKYLPADMAKAAGSSSMAMSMGVGLLFGQSLGSQAGS
jgi:hypothetical protein